MRSRQRCSSPASVPSDSSSKVSSRSRTCRASTGATPPLEIAITSGERSTIAGTMKLDNPASSTTLTRTCRSRAVAATRALTAGSLVAATTSVAPASCEGANSRASQPTETSPRPRRSPQSDSADDAAATQSDPAPPVRRAHQPRAATAPYARRPRRRRRRARAGCAGPRTVGNSAWLPYPSRPCRPHSRFRPKKRVASASPASARERVVCQSPIET